MMSPSAATVRATVLEQPARNHVAVSIVRHQTVAARDEGAMHCRDLCPDGLGANRAGVNQVHQHIRAGVQVGVGRVDDRGAA
jgi:hypothetical protein